MQKAIFLWSAVSAGSQEISRLTTAYTLNDIPLHGTRKNFHCMDIRWTSTCINTVSPCTDAEDIKSNAKICTGGECVPREIKSCLFRITFEAINRHQCMLT